MKTHEDLSSERSTAALLLVLGSSSRCGTVSWCPHSDTPAPVLQRALEVKLAVEADLRSPWGQLEEASSKQPQATALLHGLRIARGVTQEASESLSRSQRLS